MNGHFSDTLIEALKCYSLGEQVILFLKIEDIPLLECLTCGHVPRPAMCVSLTYHKHKTSCHYCGFNC
jgi:primosomal protein N'